jgi:hypothetical protein
MWGAGIAQRYLTPTLCLLSDNCGFLVVERPLWQEDRSVIYSYNCFCQSSHSWIQVQQNSHHILLSYMRLPQPGAPGPRIYIPQEQGDPVIPLLAGFAFCCLLRLAGLPTVEVFMGRCVLLT